MFDVLRDGEATFSGSLCFIWLSFSTFSSTQLAFNVEVEEDDEEEEEEKEEEEEEKGQQP